MKMEKVVVALMVAGLSVVLVESADAMGRPKGGGPQGQRAEKMKSLTQSVYVCPDCHVLELKAGTCRMCGKALQEKHLLGFKKGTALLCDCAAGCKCMADGVKDDQCACGKEVKKMEAKGLYVCPKGCPEASDKPGVCMCGEPLKPIK